MSTQQWQDFLKTNVNQQPQDSIASSLQNETVMCDLSHLGLLQLSGDDAVGFLQGQVTNDVKQLNGQIAHYTGYCNPKGRLLALFLAFAHQDHLHLQFPKELTAAVAKRLKMYVMRSKVDIQDLSESIIKIGLYGKNAPELLSTLFATIPRQDYALVTLQNGTLIKLPGAQPRFEIFCDITHATALWSSLLPAVKIMHAAQWELLEIQAGIPEVYAATQEEFVPQMLNLDILNAINFKKGCYTGQEIVARTHYLGKVKRRTYLAHVACAIAPVVGADILNDKGDIVGKVVRSAPTGPGWFDLLAEIRSESVSNSLVTINGDALQIDTLPYDV